MLGKWPIRVKFLVGLGLLLSLVAVLSFGGLHTTYSYRSLVKSLHWRAIELPLAAELAQQVAELRIGLGELRGLRGGPLSHTEPIQMPLRGWIVRYQFCEGLDQIDSTLDEYRDQLEGKVREGGWPIADTDREWATVHQIEVALKTIRGLNRHESWVLDGEQAREMERELEKLQQLTGELPSHLHRKLAGFADEVRNEYRTLIVAMWLLAIAAAMILGLVVHLFFRWVFRPLRTLIDGSRRVAGGEFAHRIRLDSDDEMAELAAAMNEMTARFQAIRDDLDRQVLERTRQVVRAEQLASVGFLAAGVAHEINNPLASIAMCAESLEGRLAELAAADRPDGSGPVDQSVFVHYLRMIQDEAFRCKSITEKLLDFSRIGPVQRQSTELGELVQGVIEMVRHLGKYQSMEVSFSAEGPALASVHPQETKQVVLNLLTNALDSLDPGGLVRVHLATRRGYAELTVQDNGCGMEPDVLRHVFEPFFTRRRHGQGTGLGLSITSRIVSDHGGEIDVHSDGPGRGSTFRVRLPLAEPDKETRHQHRAA